MATPVADERDGDELLAMRRPTALSLQVTTSNEPDDAVDASKQTLTTPKKKWMLRWRLQHQHQQDKTEEPQAGPQPQPQPQTEALRVATPAEAREAAADSPDSRSPSHGASETMTQASVPTAPPTASISPSAKAKDAETARSRTPSPMKMPMARETALPSLPASERTTSESSSISSAASSMASAEAANDASPTTPTGADHRAAPKRERREEPMTSTTSAGGDTAAEPNAGTLDKGDEEPKRALTESERARLARRKKRKSNWDVGDPRKHGGSLDLAALNLLSSINPPASHPASFAKFPRQRPPLRQSHSLDPAASSSHQQPPRTPVFGNSTAAMAAAANANANAIAIASPPLHSAYTSPTGPPPAPRRAFHYSTSLPLEQTRPTRAPPSASAAPSARRSPPTGSYR